MLLFKILGRKLNSDEKKIRDHIFTTGILLEITKMLGWSYETDWNVFNFSPFFYLKAKYILLEVQMVLELNVVFIDISLVSI